MIFQKNVNGVDYTYEESFWTGKKKLSMNGVPLTPVSRREFRYLDQGGAERRISVKGNFLGGITLLYDGQIRPAVRKGLSAAVYTQLTDVEGELNGLITYDRRELKIPAEAVRSMVKMPALKK